jgi:hypothetical protein
MTRTTVQPHFDSVRNKKTFEEAYASVAEKPGRIYQTPGGKDYTANSAITSKGPNVGKKVIIFKQAGKEMARAYPCCWGKRTNCNKTYIDSYTPNI